MSDELASIERAVWAAIQDQRPVTLDDLGMVTGCDPGECLTYLNVLLRHRYVSVLGIRRATSGEAIPLFRLTRATGPEAPYGNADDMFCDPNIKEQPKPKRPQLEMPTMVARIRLAGERLGLVFGKEALREAVGRSREFTVGWNRLKNGKELIEAGPDETGSLLFRLVCKNNLGPLREFFKANPGRLIKGSELKRAVPETRHGSVIKQALDMLAAEGYKVTIVAKQSADWAKYRVDPPEEVFIEKS